MRNRWTEVVGEKPTDRVSQSRVSRIHQCSHGRREDPNRCTASAEVDWDLDPLAQARNASAGGISPLFAAV